MINKYFSILTLISAIAMIGCSSSSPSTQVYSCTLPCLQVAPALSTTSILSATGGTIDVTLNFSGNIADINRVDIFLRDINSGNNAGFSYIFSPTTQILTETITIASGTPLSSYYPFIIIYTNTNNTSSQYYADTTISSNQYTYYEINNNNPSQLMTSPFTIPIFQIN